MSKYDGSPVETSNIKSDFCRSPAGFPSDRSVPESPFRWDSPKGRSPDSELDRQKWGKKPSPFGGAKENPAKGFSF